MAFLQYVFVNGELSHYLRKKICHSLASYIETAFRLFIPQSLDQSYSLDKTNKKKEDVLNHD